jgi:iron complex outermembrane receptor protein
MIVRGDVYAQSVSYLTNENFSTEPGSGLPAYHLINLHLDWNGVMNSRYSISAFATNVGNERYYSGGIGEGDSLGLNIAVPGIPRMYGVSVTARF